MLRSWSPGKVPLATLSILRRSTWPVVREGHGRGRPPPADEAQRDPDQFAQRVHVWPGSLVGLAGGHGVGEHASDGLRHVFYIDWLQAGGAGGREREDWEHTPQ